MALPSSTKTISHGGALQSSCFKGDILARRRSSAYALSEERPVCTNGQERRYSASLVSDFAHARASRVHKRTRDRPNRHPRVRKSTRHKAACAQTDTSCPHSPRGRPLAHAAALVARECGRRDAGTNLRASGNAHARRHAHGQTRPVFAPGGPCMPPSNVWTDPPGCERQSTRSRPQKYLGRT
jgi:hypothetical protein